MVSNSTPRPNNLTDRLRPVVAIVLQPIARSLLRLGVTADTLTVFGVILSGGVGGLLADGQSVLGGVVVLLAGPLDAVDGTLARLSGVKSKFGAFLDSTSDRYAEGFVLGGLLIYGLRMHNDWVALLALLALWGSFMVSYTRSRAETLGVDCKVGLLTRMERFVLTCAMLILNQVLLGLALLAILTHLTALQRIVFVWRAMRNN